jgi:hypothetical protein
MDESRPPGGIGGSRAPEQIAGLPYPPEDNARKRFELERERRRAEKSRKDAKDSSTPRDTWDGDSARDPEPATPPAGPGAEPERPAKREDGGLDVVV